MIYNVKIKDGMGARFAEAMRAFDPDFLWLSKGNPCKVVTHIEQDEISGWTSVAQVTRLDEIVKRRSFFDDDSDDMLTKAPGVANTGMNPVSSLYDADAFMYEVRHLPGSYVVVIDNSGFHYTNLLLRYDPTLDVMRFDDTTLSPVPMLLDMVRSEVLIAIKVIYKTAVLSNAMQFNGMSISGCRIDHIIRRVTMFT